VNKVNVISTSVQPRLRLSLVASDTISPGEVIVACSHGEVTGHRTWRTVQIGQNRHIKNELLDYVDHSCHPNAVFVIEALQLVALRAIAAGEPITFFYPGTEVELAEAFQCSCGSERCLGWVTGAFYLTADQMREAIDAGYCTTFIRAHLERLLSGTLRA
jgi:SET domain-containing protein